MAKKEANAPKTRTIMLPEHIREQAFAIAEAAASDGGKHKKPKNFEPDMILSLSPSDWKKIQDPYVKKFCESAYSFLSEALDQSFTPGIAGSEFIQKNPGPKKPAKPEVLPVGPQTVPAQPAEIAEPKLAPIQVKMTKVEKDPLGEIPFFYGDSSFFEKNKHGKTPSQIEFQKRSLKGAMKQIVNLFWKNKKNVSGEDAYYPTGASSETLSQVDLERYSKLAISAISHALVQLLFEVDPKVLEEILNLLEIKVEEDGKSFVVKIQSASPEVMNRPSVRKAFTKIFYDLIHASLTPVSLTKLLLQFSQMQVKK